MAYYKDLTRYEYSNGLFQCAGELYNVGWLERCAAYSKGAVDPDLTTKLLSLCKFPVNRYMGWHGCHYCNECPIRITDSEGNVSLGDGEIRVPAKDERVTYVAPNLIYHYVVAHEYLPPDVFLDALRALSVPNPAVVWILEWIEGFQKQPQMSSGKKPVPLAVWERGLKSKARAFSEPTESSRGVSKTHGIGIMV